MKTFIFALLGVLCFSSFAGEIPLLYSCNDLDREHNKDIYSTYGDNSNHRILISMAKCSNSENERRRLLQIVADRGLPVGKYLLAEFEYTENWEIEETKDLERLKKAYNLFMETLESIQQQPNYPYVRPIGGKKAYNDSYYEMQLGILPHSCISKAYALYEIQLKVPFTTNGNGSYIFNTPTHQILRYKDLQKQICGSLNDNNQPLETAINYRAKFKKNILEKRRKEISSFDERYQENFNKLDNKELGEFFKDLSPPTDN